MEERFRKIVLKKSRTAWSRERQVRDKAGERIRQDSERGR